MSTEIAKQVKEIIAPFAGQKNVTQKRIKALTDAGFDVQYWGKKWNWGVSGTIQEVDEKSVFSQLEYAKGRGKANLCFIHKITKKS